MTSLAVTLHERANQRGMALRAPLPLGLVYKPKSPINGITCSIHFSLLLLHSTRYETCLLFVESLNSQRTGHKKRHRPKASRFVDRSSCRDEELVEQATLYGAPEEGRGRQALRWVRMDSSYLGFFGMDDGFLLLPLYGRHH